MQQHEKTGFLFGLNIELAEALLHSEECWISLFKPEALYIRSQPSVSFWLKLSHISRKVIKDVAFYLLLPFKIRSFEAGCLKKNPSEISREKRSCSLNNNKREVCKKSYLIFKTSSLFTISFTSRGQFTKWSFVLVSGFHFNKQIENLFKSKCFQKLTDFYAKSDSSF